MDNSRTARKNKAIAAADRRRRAALDEARRLYNLEMAPVLAKYREATEYTEAEYERDQNYIRLTFE